MNLVSSVRHNMLKSAKLDLPICFFAHQALYEDADVL